MKRHNRGQTRLIAVFFSECALPEFYGDEFCDDLNNNAECNFDGGDCCGTDVNKLFCNECQCLQGLK